MILVFLLLIIFIVLPLAVNDGHLLRVLLLAVLLEVVKILAIMLVSSILLNFNNSEFSLLEKLFLISFFLVKLPELIICNGEVHVSTLIKILAYSANVVWNLVPAFLISFCWPEKRPEDVTK